MRNFFRIICLLALVSFCVDATIGQAPAGNSALNAGPSDAKAARLFAKAQKDIEDHKFPSALEGFRKADQQDGGHCLACEMEACNTAKQLGDYKIAREETTLLLAHVITPEDKAQVHYLAGDICLAEGGYRIFETPFQQADGEFQAALELQPGKPSCIYADGLALAHLHRYDRAKERFEQYLKLNGTGEVEGRRARLFAAQLELARKRIAPNFRIATADGKTVSMESLTGKVVLIDFWATWCGPCKQALPHLKEIVQKFQGQPLVVLSVSLDADEAVWKTFVAQKGMTWTQYRDGGFDGPVASQFAVKAIPTTFTIDADGFVQDQQVGDGEIEAKLKKLVAQAQVASAGKTVAGLQ